MAYQLAAHAVSSQQTAIIFLYIEDWQQSVKSYLAEKEI
jgi:hypothetical protein